MTSFSSLMAERVAREILYGRSEPAPSPWETAAKSVAGSRRSRHRSDDVLQQDRDRERPSLGSWRGQGVLIKVEFPLGQIDQPRLVSQLLGPRPSLPADVLNRTTAPGTVGQRLGQRLINLVGRMVSLQPQDLFRLIPDVALLRLLQPVEVWILEIDGQKVGYQVSCG